MKVFCFVIKFSNNCVLQTSLLLEASQKGDISDIRKLVKRGADINAEDENGVKAFLDLCHL